MYPAFLHFSHSPSRLFRLTAMHFHDRFAEFLSASEIIEATPALLNDQRRRFVSSPDIVLQPNSVESVQKIMRFCFENRIRVTPQGGNTGLCGATVTTEGVLLNLSKLNRIRDINLADNSMTVEAGVILQMLKRQQPKPDDCFRSALPAKALAKSAAISPAMPAV